MNQQTTSKAPLIAIALMVKNESSSIQGTLYSMYKAGIRDFFVLDTGSTDNTIEITHAFYKRHQVNGHIQQEPFINFAASRNRTLEIAEQLFPTIPFLLMPDADWYLRNGQALQTICEHEKNSDTPLYALSIKLGELDFTTVRLFRTASRSRFEGVVHEVPIPAKTVKLPGSVYFQVDPTSNGREKTGRRLPQDLSLLLKAYAENPQNPRNTFYLAQTYHALNDIDNAYKFYQYREQLNGFDEETFVTLCRLGNLAMLVKQPSNLIGWDIAMHYYLKAFALRPHRIEPLLEMANHYWPENIQACYLFAKYAYDKPYPANEAHCVSKEAYQYTRYEIMSRCAAHMGEFELGEEATQRALKARPGTPHLVNNLELYQKRAIPLPPTTTQTVPS